MSSNLKPELHPLQQRPSTSYPATWSLRLEQLHPEHPLLRSLPSHPLATEEKSRPRNPHQTPPSYPRTSSHLSPRHQRAVIHTLCYSRRLTSLSSIHFFLLPTSSKSAQHGPTYKSFAAPSAQYLESTTLSITIKKHGRIALLRCRRKTVQQALPACVWEVRMGHTCCYIFTDADSSSDTEVIREKVQDGVTGETKEMQYTQCKIVGNGSFGVVFQTKLAPNGEDAAIKRVLQDKRFKVSTESYHNYVFVTLIEAEP